jgi:hypothetical protein
METKMFGDVFFVDLFNPCDGYQIAQGPFDSLDAVMAAFDGEGMSDTLPLRVRGPGNLMYAESYDGNVFRYDPPRKFQ